MRVASWLPVGTSGAWEIRRKAVAPDVTELVEHSADGRELLWMDDADTELAAHRDILAAARGDVLLLGLGIGLLPAMLADVDAVRSITIIERSTDVMRLVEPHLMSEFGSRKGIRIITSDADTWQPAGDRYDVVWIDHVLKPIQGDEREAWLAKARGWADVVLDWRGAI